MIEGARWEMAAATHLAMPGPSVAVIGGGISGLMVAVKLKQLGVSALLYSLSVP